MLKEQASLDDLAVVIRSGQVSHRDAQAIVDKTPGLKEYMAATSFVNYAPGNVEPPAMNSVIDKKF